MLFHPNLLWRLSITAKSRLTLACALGLAAVPSVLTLLMAPEQAAILLTLLMLLMLPMAQRQLPYSLFAPGKFDDSALDDAAPVVPIPPVAIAAVKSSTTEALSTQPLLPHFHLDACVGRGASSVVYRAHRPGSDQPLALKLLELPPAMPIEEAESLHTRFFREARTARALRHPHIIRVDEVGIIAGQGYIALEWFEGGDLAAHVKPDNLLPPNTVFTLISQAAAALQYAHRLGVVHRDIKPANLMFDAQRTLVRIGDFGVARVVAAHHTQTGMVLGTPAYMSPEQLAGQKIDGRSDIYSLTVTLFQLLTGVLPFSGASLGQLMYRIVNDPPPDIHALRPGLPDGLENIIARGLSKNPLGRYAQASELAHALVTLSSALDPSAPLATSAALPIDIEL